MIRRGGLAIFASLATAAAGAELKLPALFTDHAVLQRDRPINVWGEAQAGATVTVTLGSATTSAQASAQGFWEAALPAQPAGGPHVLVVRSGEQELRVNDVLVGDVWLCTGQSNMVWNVRASLNGRAEVAASANNGIRQVTIPMVSSPSRREGFDKALEWKIAGPETTGDFSASCYFFVRELAKIGRAHV